MFIDKLIEFLNESKSTSFPEVTLVTKEYVSPKDTVFIYVDEPETKSIETGGAINQCSNSLCFMSVIVKVANIENTSPERSIVDVIVAGLYSHICNDKTLGGRAVTASILENEKAEDSFIGEPVVFCRIALDVKYFMRLT
jgi:hypothetical protein